jgi:hypothetical protein
MSIQIQVVSQVEHEDASCSAMGMFFGHPAREAQRPQRQLSERRQARVLPLQRSDWPQGRKKFLSAF